MKNKAGILFMTIGIVLILLALSLLLYNSQEAIHADRTAQAALLEVAKIQEMRHPDIEREIFEISAEIEKMPVVVVDEHNYIGSLTVPVLDLGLPVMAEWDYKLLKMSPCRYYGSIETDDLVVAAHNYERHFGRMKELKNGDQVHFTTMDGYVLYYEVAEVEQLSPTAIEEMVIAPEYDLTLFTCTYGGEARVAVRCKRMNSDESLIRLGPDYE